MFSSPAEHLEHELKRLDLLLHRESLRLRAGYQLSDDERRGIYVSDEQIDALVNAALGGHVPRQPPADVVAELTRGALEMRARNAARVRSRPRRELAVEIGVQRLSPSAAAVAILPLEESGDRYNLALALPEVHAMKQPATLITPRGFFKSGRILYLDHSYRTRPIKATKLVELSGAFERFQYSTVEP